MTVADIYKIIMLLAIVLAIIGRRFATVETMAVSVARIVYTKVRCLQTGMLSYNMAYVIIALLLTLLILFLGVG